MDLLLHFLWKEVCENFNKDCTPGSTTEIAVRENHVSINRGREF